MIVEEDRDWLKTILPQTWTSHIDSKIISNNVNNVEHPIKYYSLKMFYQRLPGEFYNFQNIIYMYI